MNRLERFRMALATCRELLGSLWKGRYWWLVPVVLTLLPLAAIFVFLQSVPLVAPFVYALF